MQVRLVGGFSRLMAQTMLTRARIFGAFWGFCWHCCQFRESYSPNPLLSGVIGVKRAKFKLSYYRHYFIDHNQILYSDNDR